MFAQIARNMVVLLIWLTDDDFLDGEFGLAPIMDDNYQLIKDLAARLQTTEEDVLHRALVLLDASEFRATRIRMCGGPLMAVAAPRPANVPSNRALRQPSSLVVAVPDNALDALPQAERAAWLQFWSDVAVALQKAANRDRILAINRFQLHTSKRR